MQRSWFTFFFQLNSNVHQVFLWFHETYLFHLNSPFTIIIQCLKPQKVHLNICLHSSCVLQFIKPFIDKYLLVYILEPWLMNHNQDRLELLLFSRICDLEVWWFIMKKLKLFFHIKVTIRLHFQIWWLFQNFNLKINIMILQKTFRTEVDSWFLELICSYVII